MLNLKNIMGVNESPKGTFLNMYRDKAKKKKKKNQTNQNMCVYCHMLKKLGLVGRK